MRGHLDCCADVEVEQVREISEGFREDEWVCRCRRCGQYWFSSRWNESLGGRKLEEIRYFRITQAEAEKMMRGSARGLLEHRDAIAVLNGATVRRVKGFGPV
jgi:NMD protein affecting ribosome stability and mRNA decay